VAAQLVYYCAQTLIKISLLLMYHRIFGINKRFRIANYIAGVLIIVWWLASFWDTVFQCVPVQAEWDKAISNPECQNIEMAALAPAFSNLIMDLLFVVLPLPMTWNLQLDGRAESSLTFYLRA